MKNDIKNILLLFAIMGISVVADHYNMYAPLVITTILYAIFEIVKVLKSNDWTITGLAYNKLLIVQIWAMYIIASWWYLISEYYNVPKIGLGL